MRKERFGFFLKIFSTPGVFICLCIQFILFTGTACTAGKLDIMVSILPQKYFAEKIGGDRVEVSVMVEPGADPATYEPRPRQMAMLGRARLYFALGVPFERTWLKRFREINPRLEIVPTQEGIRLFPIISNDTSGERARSEGSTEIKDPHIWLSPPLVMLQARNMLTALVRARPEDSAYFRKNYLSFVQLVARTDLRIMDIFQPGRKGKGEKRMFMVYHPCWGYFARAYGLRQVAIEEGGKEPKPARLVQLARFAREKGIASVFVQPQYSRKSARAVADSISAKLVPVDPLAYEWDRNLLSVAAMIKENLR